MRRERDERVSADEHAFAPYVRTLGRGPGRSRALNREEARTALAMVLRGEADPHQIGAFLMLLRYRGEDPEEIVGLTLTAREAIRAGPLTGSRPVDLDWPSYGAGRTRAAPWYLLAALALARAGYRVLMHGSNEFSAGIGVPEALPALGLRAATDRADAQRLLDEIGFAYLPLAALSPELAQLLSLRRLLGLRSPINTVARLLDPCDARAGVDGVFHPPYIALHLAVAERLNRPSLLVLKGGGGEVERNPAKPIAAHLYARGTDNRELILPPLHAAKSTAASTDLVRVWLGEDDGGAASATVIATIALALLAMAVTSDPAEADMLAAGIWRARGSTASLR